MLGFISVTVVIVLTHIACAIYFFGYKYKKDLKKNVSFLGTKIDNKNLNEEEHQINPKYFKLINYAFIDYNDENEKV